MARKQDNLKGDYKKLIQLIIYASHFMTITPVSTSSENVGQEKGNHKKLNILITKIAFQVK